MLTTVYNVKTLEGKSVANMYGYYAVKSLVRAGKKFTAKNVVKNKSANFRVEDFELVSVQTLVSKLSEILPTKG